METKIYTITDLERDHEKIVEAAEIIRNGGLVAFPTDTVYALGASLESEEAILKLFEVKNRPMIHRKKIRWRLGMSPEEI